MIVGIDEVGRGCWAGPLCVGAVVLSDSTDRSLLADSKQLSAKKRIEAAAHIQRTAAAIGIGWASAKYIDRYGLSKSLSLAMEKALSQINCDYDEVILDGTVNYLKDRQVTLLAKADSLIPAVSAASLIAKVARDNYMKAIDSHFQGYSFGRHVGYGTALHRKAIEELGPTPLHRMTFSPLAQFTQEDQKTYRSQTAGSIAESKAALFLVDKGYIVIDTNWKTKWCEIDIIAEKDEIIYFVEVKYRSQDYSGRGLEYITHKKMKQMKFAAEMWLQQYETGKQCRLSALELKGGEFAISEFIDNLT